MNELLISDLDREPDLLDQRIACGTTYILDRLAYHNNLSKYFPDPGVSFLKQEKRDQKKEGSPF